MKNTNFVGKNTKNHYYSKSGGAPDPPTPPNDVPEFDILQVSKLRENSITHSTSPLY